MFFLLLLEASIPMFLIKKGARGWHCPPQTRNQRSQLSRHFDWTFVYLMGRLVEARWWKQGRVCQPGHWDEQWLGRTPAKKPRLTLVGEFTIAAVTMCRNLPEGTPGSLAKPATEETKGNSRIQAKHLRVSPVRHFITVASTVLVNTKKPAWTFVSIYSTSLWFSARRKMKTN